MPGSMTQLHADIHPVARAPHLGREPPRLSPHGEDGIVAPGHRRRLSDPPRLRPRQGQAADPTRQSCHRSIVTTYRKRELLIGGGLATVYYLLVLNRLDFFGHLEQVKWWAPDSLTYRMTGDWLLGRVDFAHANLAVSVRPFLFPLIVAACEAIHPDAIVVLQYLLWLATAGLVLATLSLLLRRRWLVYALCVVYVSAISPIALTVTVLSETTAIFLLSLAIWMLTASSRDGDDRKRFAFLVALSLAAVVRPVCLYIYLLGCVWVAISMRRYQRLAWFLGVSALPIVLQVAIMYTHFGIFKVSTVDLRAVDAYLLADVQANLNHTDIETEMRRRADAMRAFVPTATESRSGGCYLSWPFLDLRPYQSAVLRDALHSFRSNFRTFLETFGTQLQGNTVGGSNFVEIVSPNKFALDVTAYRNRVLSSLGVLCVLALLMGGVFAVYRHGLAAVIHRHGALIFVAAIAAYQIATSGITFWQGDRLSVASYPLVILLLGWCTEWVTARIRIRHWVVP